MLGGGLHKVLSVFDHVEHISFFCWTLTPPVASHHGVKTSAPGYPLNRVRSIFFQLVVNVILNVSQCYLFHVRFLLAKSFISCKLKANKRYLFFSIYVVSISSRNDFVWRERRGGGDCGLLSVVEEALGTQRDLRHLPAIVC